MADDPVSFIVFQRARSVVFPPGTLLNVIAFIPKESLLSEEMIVLQLIKMSTVTVKQAPDDPSKLIVKMYKSAFYEQGTIVFRFAADAREGLKEVT